ncbi:hypothetical protein GCM10027511_01360 [Hymenobacter humi]
MGGGLLAQLRNLRFGTVGAQKSVVNSGGKGHGAKVGGMNHAYGAACGVVGPGCSYAARDYESSAKRACFSN